MPAKDSSPPVARKRARNTNVKPTPLQGPFGAKIKQWLATKAGQRQFFETLDKVGALKWLRETPPEEREQQLEYLRASADTDFQIWQIWNYLRGQAARLAEGPHKAGETPAPPNPHPATETATAHPDELSIPKPRRDAIHTAIAKVFAAAGSREITGPQVVEAVKAEQPKVPVRQIKACLKNKSYDDRLIRKPRKS
jgi:hypothetical protein